MQRQDDGLHVSEDDASGGTKGHGVRYVLGISLVLVVVAMSAIWIIPALTG